MVWAGTWDPSCAREEPVFKAQQREPLVPQAEHPMPSGHLLSPTPLLVEGLYGAPTDILPNSALFYSICLCPMGISIWWIP